MFETLELEDAKATETLFCLTEISDTCKTEFLFGMLSLHPRRKRIYRIQVC